MAEARIALLAAALTLVLCVPILACQVPVFRYALERWSADRYRIFVLHEGKLGRELEEQVFALRNAAKSASGRKATIDLKVLDLRKSSEKDVPLEFQRAWASRADSNAPLMLAYYPLANAVQHQGPAFTAPLSSSTVTYVLESPLRQKLTQRLAQGASAVWIFVPCGKEVEDTEAYHRLEKQLVEDANWLELPTAKELEVDPQTLEAAKIPLKIEFSILTLEREDPAEQFLLQTLLQSEEDLTDFDQPLAFPVFGRGRVLYALVGKGIASDTIRAASSFMVGPCSCQVKNQNPGFDLLLKSNWDEVLGETLISEPIESLDASGLEPKLLTIPPGRKKK